jgi:hypothetical protein
MDPNRMQLGWRLAERRTRHIAARRQAWVKRDMEVDLKPPGALAS